MKPVALAAILGCLLSSACDKPAGAPAAAAETSAAAGDSAAPAAPDPVTAPAGNAAVPVDEAGAAQVDKSIDGLLGDHTRYKAAIESLQQAVAANDSAAVAALISYPIDVEINGRKTTLKDEKAFIADYDKFMTPAIAKAIADARYADVLVNWQGVMLGNGEVWINGICKAGSNDCGEFDVKVITIQPTAP
ncbi:hypothetical protein [Pseudoxanthomonas wuyuanensis]